MRRGIVVLIIVISAIGCSDKNEIDLGDSPWLIPVSNVVDGGPGRDGIPALDNPPSTEVASIDYLDDADLVVGYYDGSSAIAYPHQILDWHEIINDKINEFPLAIIYCPLTGTAIGWDRNINSEVSSFGVSGLLYNNNLIPFDRQTNSNWSQMRLECVNGALINSKVTTFQLLETRWDTWKEMYPDTKVLSLNTGHDRPYGTYPYGDYKTNEENLLFPLEIDDRRMHRKERVHGIISNGIAKAYRFSSFDSRTTLINDAFDGSDIIVVGNKAKNYIVSFYAQLADGSPLEFLPLDEDNVILKDDRGNKWDVFGFAVSGPDQGQRLQATESFIGYWFSWGVFYPDIEICEM